MAHPPIPTGTTVRATLQLDLRASGPAQLMIAHPSGVDATSVAPGTSDTVKLRPTRRGILKVLVDLSDDADTGTLTVEPPGPDGLVTGDQVESYVVITRRR